MLNSLGLVVPAGGLIEVTWCLRSDVIPRLRRDFVRLLLLLLSREDSYVAAIPFSDYLSSTVARWIIEKSGFLRLESSSALLIKRREKGGGRRACFSRIVRPWLYFRIKIVIFDFSRHFRFLKIEKYLELKCKKILIRQFYVKLLPYDFLLDRWSENYNYKTLKRYFHLYTYNFPFKEIVRLQFFKSFQSKPSTKTRYRKIKEVKRPFSNIF